MQDRIVEFSNLLRRNGVRVSLSENIDTFRALALLGVRDPLVFRNTLRATLVKRAVDHKTFEDLFDMFFLGLGEALQEADRRMMEELGMSPAEFEQMLEKVRQMLDRGQEHLSELARALLSGNMGQVERLVREAAEPEAGARLQDGVRIAAYSRMAARISLDQLQDEMDRFRSTFLLQDEEAKAATLLSRYIDQRLRDLNRIMRDLIKREAQKAGSETGMRDHRDYLAEKSFAYYTEEDIRRMNEVVARLAQRLKNRFSVRRRKAAKGRFDIKRTLRNNLQFGGVPFQIQKERRRKEKPQVVVLCDISDSVLNASRFMLQFVYSVQDLYSKVRSFVFVSDIGEVTQLFKEYDIHQAIDAALKGEIVDVFTHSNFGRAFEGFFLNFESAVTSKTTVLIIGDGRNNYNRANEWVLKEIQQRAKQLIWLNPESAMTWGVGDSEMPRYGPCCDIVEECRNIGQLYNVIDLIVP